jgi:hypothetical protein
MVTALAEESADVDRTRFRSIKCRLRIRDDIMHKTVLMPEGESYNTGQPTP